MSGSRKFLIFLVIVSILGLTTIGVLSFIEYNTKTPELEPDEDVVEIKDEIKNTDKYIAIIEKSGEKKLSAILEDGSIKDLNISVLATDGVGSKSFDIDGSNLYYIDQDNKLNLYETRYEKTTPIETIEVTDHTDLYVINQGVMIFTEAGSYYYNSESEKLIKIDIYSPVGDNGRYYNKVDNNIYYRDNNNNIMSYSFTNKQEKNLFNSYMIMGSISTSTYLVLKKDNKFYLYDYKDTNLKEFFEIKNQEDSILYVGDKYFIYTHENKIIKKTFDGAEEVLSEIDLQGAEGITSYDSIHTSSMAFIQTIAGECAGDTCGPTTKNIYLYDFTTKKTTDMTDKYKASLYTFKSLNK